MQIKPKCKFTAVSPVLMLVLSLVCISTQSKAKLNDTTLQFKDKTFLGQHDAKILTYKIIVPPSKNDIIYKASKFYFSTKGTTNNQDIINAHLYFTGINDYSNLPLNGADTAGKIISKPNGTFVFITNKQMHSGTNYFLLTYDISTTGNVGDFVDATLDSVKINDTLWSVRSGNPAGNRYIDIFGSYCNVSVAIPNSVNPQYIGISNVKIGKAINNSSADLDMLTVYPYPAISVYRQETFPVEIKYGQGHSEQIIAWADWNNDGIFDPNTEEVFYTSSSLPGETYYTNLTIPCTATVGSHKIRIMDDIDTIAKLTPCGGLRYGDAEEYIINVLPDIYPASITFAIDTPTFLGSPVVFRNTSNVRGNYVCQWCFSNTCIKSGVYDATGNVVSYTWPQNPGVYKVKMTLVWAGCDSTFTASCTDSIKIVSPGYAPKSSFIASENIIDTTSIIQFTDLSTGKPGSWYWQISPSVLNGKPSYVYLNGTSYYSQNPVIKFNHQGQYDVSLTAHNGRGLDKSAKTKYISVIDYATMCSGNDTITSSSGFLYDDGGKNHPYGNNKSCFIVIKPPCATAININFNAFDVSSYGAGNDNLQIFDSTNKSGSSLNASAGYINGYQNSNPGNVPIHPKNIKALSGSAYIQWNTDSSFVGDGFAIHWTSDLRTSSPPKASFICPDTIYIHHSIAFTNNSTGPELHYFWDLSGDGIIDDNQQNPTYTYDSAGLFRIMLIGQNCGGADTFYKFIVVKSVKAKPIANFTANYTSIGMGDLLQFYDLSTQEPYKWQWTIKKLYGASLVSYINSSAYSQNPLVQFPDSGVYSVSLSVSNDSGSSYIFKTDYITVFYYCTPVVVTSSPAIGISRVVITNRINDTIIDQSSSCGVVGYTYFNKLNPTPLVSDDLYRITVTRDSAQGNMIGMVWLDYNKNGSFSGVDDTLLIVPNITGTTWTGTLPIRRISYGVGRLRVGVTYSNNTFDLCGQNAVGEFEDYNVILQKDTNPPVITLKGKDTVLLEEYRKYIELGATAFDNEDGDVSHSLLIENATNPTQPGYYQVTYDAQDRQGNKAVQVIRIVKVIPDTTGPSITLNGSQTMFIEVFHGYKEDSAFAKDNLDSNPSLSISGVVDTMHTGTYFITYTSKDTSGNVSIMHRRVIVGDTIKPVIKLLGKSSDTLEVLTTYIDPGVSDSDNYTKGLILKIDKLVDSTKLGKQTIVYTVFDSAGNSSSVTRKIFVGDFIAPVLRFGLDTIYWDVNKKFIDPKPISVTDNYYKSSQIKVGRYNPSKDGKVQFAVNEYILGTYLTKYFAQDPSGNKSLDSFVVKVVDRKPPVLIMQGPLIVNLYRWQRYKDIEYSFEDNYDPNPRMVETDSTEFIRDTFPNIYFYQVGTYPINYKMIDHSGNVSNSFVRWFNVIDRAGVQQADRPGTSFQCFPNPANQSTFISFNSTIDQNIAITVSDIVGNELQTIYTGTTSSFNKETDLSKLTPGLYFLNLKCENRVYPQKLIIAR